MEQVRPPNLLEVLTQAGHALLRHVRPGRSASFPLRAWLRLMRLCGWCASWAATPASAVRLRGPSLRACSRRDVAPRAAVVIVFGWPYATPQASFRISAVMLLASAVVAKLRRARARAPLAQHPTLS